jgi:hypothetical protein
MELGWTRRTESLPMHWVGGSDGQNKEGRFPMVGIGRDKKGDNRILGQVDMIIVSFRCLGTKQENGVTGNGYRGSRYLVRPRDPDLRRVVVF